MLVLWIYRFLKTPFRCWCTPLATGDSSLDFTISLFFRTLSSPQVDSWFRDSRSIKSKMVEVIRAGWCLFVCLCWLSGTGVATAIRIVHGPISFLTRHCASRLEWFIPRKIPSNATTALATLHNITCLVHMYITFNHYSIHNIEFVEMK